MNKYVYNVYVRINIRVMQGVNVCIMQILDKNNEQCRIEITVILVRTHRMCARYHSHNELVRTLHVNI